MINLNPLCANFLINNVVVGWARVRQCPTEVVVIITKYGGNLVIHRGMNLSDVTILTLLGQRLWLKVFKIQDNSTKCELLKKTKTKKKTFALDKMQT